MLQAALLVIAYVLADHLWSQDKGAASITVAGAEVLCIILIITTTIAPTFLSIFGGGLASGIRKAVRAFTSPKSGGSDFKTRTAPKRQPSVLPTCTEKDGKVEIILSQDIAMIFKKQEIDWKGFISDSLCIAWMFDRTFDSDKVTVILDFIPDVVWHSGICNVPIAIVFEIFERCFSYSDGNAALIPRLRDRAYASGRALVHLAIQRKCIGEEGCDPLKEFRGTQRSYSWRSYDKDLDSILALVDRLLGNNRPINWNGYKFTESHQRWLSHILLYRAWDHLCYSPKLPDDVEAFVTLALSTEDTHPAVVADCLFIISLVIGLPLHVDDLATTDKRWVPLMIFWPSSLTTFPSSENETLLGKIYNKLESTFKDHVVQEFDRSCDAMKLIAPVEDNTVCQSSYNLFRTILASPFDKEDIWKASRFTVHGAYKWDRFLPWVQDPNDLIKFLAHHFSIQAKGEDEIASEPIQDTLRALAYASGEMTIEALKKFDSTDKLFVDGIRKAFENDRQFQTRKAALFLMPIIQDRWFDDSLEQDVVPDDQKTEFCKNWASAVDGIEHTFDVKKAASSTLFSMLNSNKWRSHITEDKLKLMEWFTVLPDESKPINACKKNAEILPWLKCKAENPTEGEGKNSAKANQGLMKLWLAILWLDYVNLPETVRDQVLEMTKVVISKVRYDVNFVMVVMEAEKERYQTELKEYPLWSIDDKATALRLRVDNLNNSMEKFLEVVGETKPF